MKKNFFAFRKRAVFLLFFSYLGGLPAQVAENGVSEQERMITGFTSINVHDGIDVYLAPGIHNKVLVRADHHLIPRVKTEMFGQELRISIEGPYNKPQKLEVHLEMPVLRAVVAQGGSDVFTTGSFQLQDFSVQLSQGSALCLEMKANKVSCNLSDGSNAILRGKVKLLTVDARVGSILKAKDLEVQKCKLQALAGSEAYIRVTGEIEMEALQASGIYYHGTPTILYQKASNDSDIRAL